MAKDFRDGPVVENPSSNAGDTGLIPGQATKILCATTKTRCNQINKLKKKKKKGNTGHKLKCPEL